MHNCDEVVAIMKSFEKVSLKQDILSDDIIQCGNFVFLHLKLLEKNLEPHG